MKLVGILVFLGVCLPLVSSYFCELFMKKEFAECLDTCDGFGAENNIYGVFSCGGSKKCCIPDPSNRPNITTTTTSTQDTTEMESTMAPAPNVPLAEQCGVGRAPTTRILHGTMTKPCDWPWQVSVRSRVVNNGDLGPTNTFPWCSGVLINDQWVLTTAYCIILSVVSVPGGGLDNILVTAGEFNTRQVDFTGIKAHEQYVKVADIKIHPDYYKTDIDSLTADELIDTSDDKVSNNFALIKLEKPVEVNECVQKVCTPTAEQCWSKKQCKIAGWGNTNENKIGDTSLELLEADVTVYSPAVCETISEMYMNISSDMKPLTTCARPNDPDVNVCLADNGGMVVCKNADNKWTVEGLINRPSNKACVPGDMLIISYTQPAMKWIQSVTNP